MQSIMFIFLLAFLLVSLASCQEAFPQFFTADTELLRKTFDDLYAHRPKQCRDMKPPHFAEIRDGLVYSKPPKTGSTAIKQWIESLSRPYGFDIAADEYESTLWGYRSRNFSAVKATCVDHKEAYGRGETVRLLAVVDHNPPGAWMHVCFDKPLLVGSIRNPVDQTLSAAKYQTLQRVPTLLKQGPEKITAAFNHRFNQGGSITEAILTRWMLGLTTLNTFIGEYHAAWRSWVESYLLCELSNGVITEAAAWRDLNLPSVSTFLRAAVDVGEAGEKKQRRMVDAFSTALAKRGVSGMYPMEEAVVSLIHAMYDWIYVAELEQANSLTFKHLFGVDGRDFDICNLRLKFSNVLSHRQGLNVTVDMETRKKRQPRLFIRKEVTAQGKAGKRRLRGKKGAQGPERSRLFVPPHTNATVNDVLEFAKGLKMYTWLPHKRLDHLLWTTALRRHRILMNHIIHRVGSSVVQAELSAIKGRPLQSASGVQGIDCEAK